MSTKASDLFSFERDLSQTLAAATKSARGEWEAEFVGDLNDRFRRYGFQMFMSEKQCAILRRIAGMANTNGNSHQRAYPPPPPPLVKGIDKTFLRQLIQLCHPDKHSQSTLAVDVTQRLNAMRESL